MKPKVSVKITTYNHERFIAQTLDSVLSQKVNFPFEIIVGEDCSTDKTRVFLQDYQRKFPDIIRLLLNERNMGGRYNALNTRRACRGEYVAFLDGDDYWTTPDKLQKQINFLDQHPECTICFHNAKIIYDNGRDSHLFHNKPLKPFLTAEDILPGNIMPSCSMVFRNIFIEGMPKEFDQVPFGDWPIQICCIKKGKAGYINEVMGAYRVHSGGVWSQGGTQNPRVIIRHLKGELLFYQAANKYLEYQHQDLLALKIATTRKEIFDELVKKPFKKTFSGLYSIYRTLKGNGR